MSVYRPESVEQLIRSAEKQKGIYCNFCGMTFAAALGLTGLAIERHVVEVHGPVGIAAPLASRWMVQDGVFEVVNE